MLYQIVAHNNNNCVKGQRINQQVIIRQNKSNSKGIVVPNAEF